MHTGFGKFCGAVFGGILIKEHGTVFVFRVYGIVVAVFFILFVLVNFYNRNEGGITKDLPDDVDPKTFADEHAKLAGPAGVPIASMTGALDGSEEQQADPSMAGGADPNYGVNNPFLDQGDAAAAQQPQQYYDASGQLTQGDPSQQYYGAGYSQAQSGYSSAGYGLQ